MLGPKLLLFLCLVVQIVLLIDSRVSGQGNHSSGAVVQDVDQLEWWKKTNFYHIYLRSFQDSNGDGSGDLRGVILRLDYLKQIGVGTILLSPFYKSPMKDGGYDISDFTDVDPFFGSLEDFDDLVKGAHERGMRVLVDFVPNHSSDQHSWFKCSERAYIEPERCGKYKDYYVWSSSTRYEGKYPNNWISLFGGGPGWTYSEIRKEFYMHQFLPQQPDLNVRNSDVREELKNVARFWLRRGVDGLRIDAVIHLVEDLDFRDEPLNPDWKPGWDPADRLLHVHTRLFYESAILVKDWQDVICEPEFGGPKNKVVITEAYAAIPRLIEYYGIDPKVPFANMPFNFELLVRIRRDNWTPEHVENVIMDFVRPTRELGWPDEGGAISPWIIWVTGNHDNPRAPNRVGDSHKQLFKWLSYIAPGVPVNYYGDELGMASISSDLIPAATKSEGESTRLCERSPIAWDASEPSGGFSSSASIWLPLAQDYKYQNVENLLSTENNNYLQQFVTLQRLREQYLNIFVFGDLVFFKNEAVVGEKTSPILAIARTHEKFGNILLLSNLEFKSNHILESRVLELTGRKSALRHTMHEPPKRGTVILSNIVGAVGDHRFAIGREVDLTRLVLKPAEAIIIKY